HSAFNFPICSILLSTLLLSRCSSFFPYTTLFRSLVGGIVARDHPHIVAGNYLVGGGKADGEGFPFLNVVGGLVPGAQAEHHLVRSEEHTSELQSRFDLVCRLLLEKKNNLSSN